VRIVEGLCLFEAAISDRGFKLTCEEKVKSLLKGKTTTVEYHWSYAQQRGKLSRGRMFISSAGLVMT